MLAKIYPHIFILKLEIVFLFIKKHPEIKGIEIFEQLFLYTASAYNTTFLLKDLQSIAYLDEIFSTYSIFLFSGSKSNLTKYETTGTATLKEV